MATDGKLILQQREDKPGITLPGKVAMFGGTVDQGETVEEGAKRELKEEINLELFDQKLEKLGVYQKTQKLDGEEYEIHVFLVKNIDPQKLMLREGKAIVFLDIDADLEKLNLTRITKLAINDYRNRRD